MKTRSQKNTARPVLMCTDDDSSIFLGQRLIETLDSEDL